MTKMLGRVYNNVFTKSLKLSLIENSFPPLSFPSSVVKLISVPVNPPKIPDIYFFALLKNKFRNDKNAGEGL
jgi:hypothetical protein